MNEIELVGQGEAWNFRNIFIWEIVRWNFLKTKIFIKTNKISNMWMNIKIRLKDSLGYSVCECLTIQW